MGTLGLPWKTVRDGTFDHQSHNRALLDDTRWWCLNLNKISSSETLKMCITMQHVPVTTTTPRQPNPDAGDLPESDLIVCFRGEVKGHW